VQLQTKVFTAVGVSEAIRSINGSMAGGTGKNATQVGAAVAPAEEGTRDEAWTKQRRARARATEAGRRIAGVHSHTSQAV
jgi:hypothetical protein